MIAPVGRIRCPWCGEIAGIIWPSMDKTFYVTRGRESSEIENAVLGNNGAFGGLPVSAWCTDPEHRWEVPAHRLRRDVERRRAEGRLVNIQARRVR